MEKESIIKKLSLRNILYEGAIIWFNIFKIKKLEVEGKENILNEGYRIYVGNHERLLDPLPFYTYIKKVPLIARDDFLKEVPIISHFNLNINKKSYNADSILNVILSYIFDSIPVRRGEIKPSQRKMIIKKFIDNKAIGFFPTGTRSTTGSIYYTHEDIDEKKPGKLTALLQRLAGEPVNIVPVSLSYDEILNYGTVSVGKSFNIDTKGVKRLSQEEQNKFYQSVREKMMEEIGKQTKLYGDSILATIITNACKDIDEIEKYHINTDVLSNVFEDSVYAIRENKEINLYKSLEEKKFREKCLKRFIEWTWEKGIINYSEGNLLNIKEIKRVPIKLSSLIRKDVNIIYLSNKSKHINGLERIISKATNRYNPSLIYQYNQN